MMQTKRFSFFCLPFELVETFCPRERACAKFFFENEKGTLCAAPVNYLSTTRALWATVAEKKPKRLLGLLEIIPPRYKADLLCMASIAIKGDTQDETFRANVQLFRDVKKELERKFRRGVWGVNIRYGGEHYYNDIRISDGALAEHANGYLLAPEGGDGYVRFEYRPPSLLPCSTSPP